MCIETGLGRGGNFLIAMARRHTAGKAVKSVGEDRGAAFALAAGCRRITLDRRRSIAPQIAGVLRAMIVELTLEPGSAIAKDAVARAFGVSSMPVRKRDAEAAEICLRRHLSDTLPFADAIKEKYPSYF